jgi:hypothetical protein
MKPYCVTVVRYVLPAMRVLIMNELLEKYDLSKMEVAKRMCVTPAAITQYSKGVRGSSYIKELSGSEEIMKKISEISKDAADDEANFESIMDNMCEICRLIRSDKLICALHANEFPESKLNDCTMCFNDGYDNKVLT